VSSVDDVAAVRPTRRHLREETSLPLSCACIDLIKKQSPPFNFFIFFFTFLPVSF